MTDAPPASPVWGVLAIAAGAIPIGAALFADGSKFQALRWLVAMVGGMFVLAGLMLIRSARAAARPPARDVAGYCLSVLLTSGFTVLAGWALFFSGGPSAWKMSGTLPLGLLPAWVSAGLFYGLMGVGALICVALNIFAWRQLCRALATAGSAASGPRGLQ
jgi:polyferredoxin